MSHSVWFWLGRSGLLPTPQPRSGSCRQPLGEVRGGTFRKMGSGVGFLQKPATDKDSGATVRLGGGPGRSQWKMSQRGSEAGRGRKPSQVC